MHARLGERGVEDIGVVQRLHAEVLADPDRVLDLPVVRLDGQPDVHLVDVLADEQRLEVFEAAERAPAR